MNKKFSSREMSKDFRVHHDVIGGIIHNNIENCSFESKENILNDGSCQIELFLDSHSTLIILMNIRSEIGDKIWFDNFEEMKALQMKYINEILKKD